MSARVVFAAWEERLSFPKDAKPGRFVVRTEGLWLGAKVCGPEAVGGRLEAAGGAGEARGAEAFQSYLALCNQCK